MNEINEHNKQIQQNEINESTLYIYIHVYTFYIDFLGSAKQPGFFIARMSFSAKGSSSGKNGGTCTGGSRSAQSAHAEHHKT